MTPERADQIAEAASARTSQRRALPLQSVTVTADGFGVATYAYFARPGYVSLCERFTRAGGQAVTFVTRCEGGRQTTLEIYFLERAT